MKTRRIKFHSTNTSLDILPPKPASFFMPKWFKKMPPVSDNIMGVKKCVPYLDAFSSGYIVPLAADVVWDTGIKQFRSSSAVTLNSDHHQSQVEGMEIPEGFSPVPHKWVNQWMITVPKGYSVLFTHPLNRDDLPFKSFSGIVDADKHPVVINFPFLLKENFKGIIPAGTPLVQMFPFKRENWESTTIDNGDSYVYEKGYEFLNPPFGWYKKKFWTRKFYK